MAWLQGSFLGHAMRESGVWTYGVVNLVHILGVASLFGSVLVIDLRLLGFWRSTSLRRLLHQPCPSPAQALLWLLRAAFVFSQPKRPSTSTTPSSTSNFRRSLWAWRMLACFISRQLGRRVHYATYYRRNKRNSPGLAAFPFFAGLPRSRQGA